MRTSVACALTVAFLISGCDAVQPDEGKNILTEALSGVQVTLNPGSALMPPDGYDCFDDGRQKVPLVLNLKGADGGYNNVKLIYHLDVVATLKTLYALHTGNAVWTHNFGDHGNMTCFEPSIHKTWTWFGYAVPLGTLHLQTVEFINDFMQTMPLIGGTVEMRSYKVAFTIDQKQTTGQGQLDTYNTTCLVAKDQVHNVWAFQGCQ